MERSLEFGNCVLFGASRVTLLPLREIGLSTILDDLGFMRGCSAFDVASARGDDVFHLQNHLERLQNSVRGLSLSRPAAIEPPTQILESQLKTLLVRNGFKSSLVWFYVLAGPSWDGFRPLGEPRLLVRVSEFDETRICNPKGIAVKMVPYKRQMPEVKFTGDYALAEMLMAEYGPERYDEILYTADGEAFELSRRNLFLVRKDSIITPARALPGITKKIVMNLARKEGLEVREEPVHMMSLWGAEEIFATSTTSGVVRVRQVDEQKFALGPVTQRLQAAFLDYREEYFRTRVCGNIIEQRRSTERQKG